MRHRHWKFALTVAAAFTAAPSSIVHAQESPIDFFEKKVRPVLVDNCYNCHSANTNARGGLRVDDRNGLLQGGNTGAALIPGDPDSSLLIKAIKHDGNIKMPPKKELSQDEVAILTQWIKDGAAWPEIRIPNSLLSDKPNETYEKLKKEHWSWQPLKAVAAPAVEDAAWPRDDIDRFVLAKLEAKGLKPTNDAEKRSLIRRVTFDLTGLPPTPEDVEAFTKDSSSDAFAKVVDRLLASTSFGERWGRHWLDVARYAESTGSSRNIPLPHAWRYRDYVIDAFNKDKPYDQFVREQIAGDLLPFESQKQRDEQLVATGFLALGVKDVNQRFKVRFVMDNIDEQIDTVSRSVLALTASCARCHDHKFDPITTREYHALAGIFYSTDNCSGVRNKMGGGGLDYYDSEKLIALGDAVKNSPPPEKVAKLKEEVVAAKKDFDKIRGTPEGTARGPDGFPNQRKFRLKFEAAQAALAAVNDPSALGPVALGVRDAKVVGDTEIRIRGEAEKLGPVAKRGFLSVVSYEGQPEVNPQQSGRLELAQWLTNEKNPLTSRVMANRVWHHLLGRGLVSSVDNFGVTGDVPTHPELLDYLAQRLIAHQWSVKKLIREVVLTRTYQLGSDETPQNIAVDPAGQLLWRHNPRRLDAEEIRDAVLAASGSLDAYRPAGSPTNKLPFVEQRNNGPEAARFATLARESIHRSVYLPLLRGWVPTSLEVFDFAEQGMVTGSRDSTTVPPQALYLLNDPFIRKQSLALADRVLVRNDLDDTARIELAYQLALGRSATGEEIERAKMFIAEFEPVAKESLIQTAAVVTKAEADKDEAVVDAKPVAAPAAAAGGGKGKRKKNAAQAAAPAPAAIPATRPAVANAESTGAPTPAAPQIVIDPDQVVSVAEEVKEEVIDFKDARSAAWASFCQALIGSAEFRYLK